MQKLKNKVIAILLISAIITLFNANISNAVVESRPDSASLVSKTASEFFALIRQMETSGGPMGLNATVDEQGNETSSSNNIDVHMIKNTEYGTAGMLAASVYGSKSSRGYSNGTTTGNATGIYQMGTGSDGDKKEYMAAILGTASNSYITNIKNAPQKYWDNYTELKVSKTGDGTLEIPWGTTNWVTSSSTVFYRGNDYYYYYGVFHTDSYGGVRSSNYSSRAVVVSGVGL